jgi:hypothetical protein
MRMQSRDGDGQNGGLGGSPKDREALKRLIDYAVTEAIKQDLPVTARVLGLARESLATPSDLGRGHGGPDTLNPELKGQVLQ